MHKLHEIRDGLTTPLKEGDGPRREIWSLLEGPTSQGAYSIEALIDHFERDIR